MLIIKKKKIKFFILPHSKKLHYNFINVILFKFVF